MIKRYIFSLLAIVMLIVAGCGANDEVEEIESADETEAEVDTSHFPVTIDLDGEEITINEKPENIIPLSLEVAEIVLKLVDPSRVVATTNGVDDPILSTLADDVDGIEGRIGAQVNIDPEEIISYDTDLLLLVKMYGEQEDAEKTLSQLETPILSFDSMVTVEKFIDAIPIIGEAVGEQAKADELVTHMEDSIAAIQKEIPEDESPTVLILSEVGGDLGPFMMGPTNISYDLIQLAGATPAVDTIELERSTPASIEQVLKLDPDYILLADFFGKGEEGFAELMEDPGWNTLRAVEEDKMMMLDAKYIINPNVENVEGLEKLVNFIYELD